MRVASVAAVEFLLSIRFIVEVLVSTATEVAPLIFKNKNAKVVRYLKIL